MIAVHRLRDGYLLLTLLSLSPTVLHAQTVPIPAAPPTLRRHIDSLVQASIRDLPLASVSVAVLRGEDTLAFAACGYADLENRVPADPLTVYRIGSITKQFTAAAILQQVDRGTLNLDDDVAKYVPEYSSQGKRVTIRQLLNHTSGLKDLVDLGDAFLAVRSIDLPQQDVLALVRHAPFEFEPGTQRRYSNTGYYLLGVILERVTGQRYADYLEEHVWSVAGLTSTGDCDPRVIVPHRARGYDAVGTAFLNTTHVSMTFPFSSLGLCSTASDLVTWARALRSGRVISQAPFRIMTTPEGAAARASPPYGFGVWVKESGGRRHITHLGLIDGFNAVLSYVPSDSLILAIVTNTSGYGASTLGGQLGSAILGTPGPFVTRAVPLAQPRAKPLTSEERRRYIGRYRVQTKGDDGQGAGGVRTLRVFDENGRLTAQITGDPPEVLAPAGGHEFVAAGRLDIRFTFEVHEGRAIRVTVLGPDGLTTGARSPDR